MIRYILYFIFSYFLIHSGYSQCNSDIVIEFQGQLSRTNTFSNFPYGSTILSGLTESLAYFKNDLDRKGIFYENRKIGRIVICSQVTSINKIMNELACLLDKMEKKEKEIPIETDVFSSINVLEINGKNTTSMKVNLEAISKIKGVDSFFNNQNRLKEYLEESFRLTDTRIDYFACYLFQKQKLDSAQFKFTLDYIPLLIEKQQLQSKLALELNSLATKLNLYQSKKYNYIKFL